MEIRRKTLLEAMSKFQDSKQSALFQYLNNHNEHEKNENQNEHVKENHEREVPSSSSRACDGDGDGDCVDETEGREDARNAVRQDTSDGDRDRSNGSTSRRDSMPDTTTTMSIRHDHNSCSNNPKTRSHAELFAYKSSYYKPREERHTVLSQSPPTPNANTTATATANASGVRFHSSLETEDSRIRPTEPQDIQRLVLPVVELPMAGNPPSNRTEFVPAPSDESISCDDTGVADNSTTTTSSTIVRVGCDNTNTMPTTNQNVADTEYHEHEHEHEDDPMALLERKLDLMVSKKPLWQKALQDLYDDNDDEEPFGSSKASESGITNRPSAAETICFIDSPPTTTTTTTTTIDPIANAVRRQEHQTMNRAADPNAARNIKVGTHLNTNDGVSATSAETDATESWHSPSIDSIDSPNSRIGPTTTTDRHHHQENETNRVEDSKAACPGFTSMDDGEDSAPAAPAPAETIDTIESRYIQNAKNYHENLTECLSDLQHATSRTTTHADTTSKVESKLLEKDSFGNAQIEAVIESLRTAESECSSSPLVEEEQMVLTATHTRQQQCIPITSSQESHQSSSRIAEKSKQAESKIQNITSAEHARNKFDLGFPRLEKSVDTIAPLLDEEQIASMRDEQQHTTSSIEIMCNTIQSNPRNAAEIDSPRTTEGQYMVVSQDEEQIASMCDEQQHATSSIEIMCNTIQSNQQHEVEIDSPRTTEGQYMVVSQDEEQIASTHVEQQTMYIQPNPQNVVTIESPRIAESNGVEKVDEEQINSIHAEQQHFQSLYLQSNQWKMSRPDAHLKTPRVSNNGKQLLYLESEKIVDTNMLQLQNETPQQSCSESDVFGDIDLLSQEQSDARNVSNRSDYFGWGVASDLSEDTTDSLGCSSSTDCSSVEINSHHVENENDGIGEQDSGESLMKPPIPNEVTMLTDFTIQSITFTSNNSNMESLGEQSLVQEIQQPNGNKSAAKYVMSSNSESTIIGERRNAERKTRGAPNATELKTTSCTKGLLKVLKTTSLLCQCANPVEVNDIYTLVPR